jgi:phosphate transport system substrate-binding protein
MALSEVTEDIWLQKMRKKMTINKWNLKNNYQSKWKVFLSACVMAVGLLGCGNNSQPKERQESASYGTIRISVDETFKPIIDSQIKVYQATYPEANIIAEYKSEAECLKDLNSDSTRLVIVTRGLSETEAGSLKEKFSSQPAWGILAFDAVALILNKQAKDSVFSMEDVRQMLDGNTAYNYNIVMDGLTATSTVRYAIDTILKGKPLGAKVTAESSSPKVIDFVSRNPNSIGFIGVSWIGNSDDGEQLSFLDKVKMASIQCELCPDSPYTKPYQANIATGRYPLTRGLYYILKENWSGLGRGFVNFMIGEKGQLIFKRAYLLPARMSFNVRQVKISG